MHGLGAVSLRYFNVAGASGPEAGGSASGTTRRPTSSRTSWPSRSAMARTRCVSIYGDDYPTPDGTCVRDYVHVADLAAAHLLALDASTAGQHRIYNLGSGTGFSNLEVVEACREVTGHPIPARVSRPAARRPRGARRLLRQDPGRAGLAPRATVARDGRRRVGVRGPGVSP